MPNMYEKLFRHICENKNIQTIVVWLNYEHVILPLETDDWCETIILYVYTLIKL